MSYSMKCIVPQIFFFILMLGALLLTSDVKSLHAMEKPHSFAGRYSVFTSFLPLAKVADATATDFSLDVNIDNPLNSEIDTIPAFIEEILRIVLKIGIPIVTLFIIYAGLLFVMAAGNSEKLKVAKETLLYTLIGAAILLGAWVIAEAIQGTLSQLGA